MENASKALIIAGAILLSILLISLGIMVYNNAKGTISDANLDTETAQAFNTKISQYCGNRKSARDMNSLIDAITASNGAQTKISQNNRHPISVTVTATGAAANYVNGTLTINVTQAAPTPTAAYPRFTAGATYSANYTTDTAGYINRVTITVTV